MISLTGRLPIAGKTTRSSISRRHVLVISALSFICNHSLAVLDALLTLRILSNWRACVGRYLLTRLLAFLASFGKFDRRILTQGKHAGFTV